MSPLVYTRSPASSPALAPGRVQSKAGSAAVAACTLAISLMACGGGMQPAEGAADKPPTPQAAPGADEATPEPTPAEPSPAPAADSPAALGSTQAIVAYAKSCQSTVKSIVVPEQVEAKLKESKTIGVRFEPPRSIPLNVVPGSPQEHEVALLVVPAAGELWADQRKYTQCDSALLDGVEPGVR